MRGRVRPNTPNILNPAPTITVGLYGLMVMAVTSKNCALPLLGRIAIDAVFLLLPTE